MASPELGDCAGFVWDLTRAGLVDRGQLEKLVVDFFRKAPGSGPKQLAAYLTRRGTITPYQAERLLDGMGQNLVLSQYVLVDVVGQGSMGSVYKAMLKSDGRMFALKMVPRRSMWNVRHARRLCRIFEQNPHPSVVAFTDVGTHGASHFLAWDLVAGESLDKCVARLGRLPAAVAALYGLHVADGLAACNKHGVVHGLVKPSNVLITPEHHARLLDFGIGALIAESKEESLVDTMSTANTVTSGLDCRSPETILEPTLRTPPGDQYSLGCVLYFCLTGRFPFQDMPPVQKMMAHQTQDPVPLRELVPQIPRQLAGVVERLMKKRPEDRYSGPEEVVEALRPLAVEPEMAEQVLAMPLEEAVAPAPEPAPAEYSAEAVGAEPASAEAEAAPEQEAAWPEEAAEPPVAAELEPFTATLPEPGEPVPAWLVKPPPAPPPRTSRRVLLLAALVGYVCGAALVGSLLWLFLRTGR